MLKFLKTGNAFTHTLPVIVFSRSLIHCSASENNFQLCYAQDRGRERCHCYKPLFVGMCLVMDAPASFCFQWNINMQKNLWFFYLWHFRLSKLHMWSNVIILGFLLEERKPFQFFVSFSQSFSSCVSQTFRKQLQPPLCAIDVGFEFIATIFMQ